MRNISIIGVIVLLFCVAVGVFFSITPKDNEGSQTLTELNADVSDPFSRGQYYFNGGNNSDGPYDLEKADFYYTEAIRRHPDGHALQWYQLGRIDFLQGRFTSAIERFEKQIEYFGEDIPNVYYMLGLTYGYRARETGDEADWQRAEEAFKHFMDIYRLDWASRVDLSWVYFAQGKYEEMKAPLEEALEAYPENPWAHNMYGLALMNTGEPRRAHEHFRKAKEYAAQLSPEDWGESYPGNDPANWPRGLAEFRATIEKNLAIVAENVQEE